jgi:hypothetical protein
VVNCGKGKYEGELCFIKGAYPYTNGGKISEKRIRNAMARAKQNGEGAALKRAGYCRLARRHHIKSEYC